MPVAAIVGGVASIAGGIMSSKAQKKAANTAAQAAADNTAANNALVREIYGQNKATLAPFVGAGTQAPSAINALLGLGGSAPAPANSNAPMTYGASNGYTPNDTMYVNDLAYSPRQLMRPQGTFYPQNAGSQAVAPAQAQTQPQGNPQQQYENAFKNYQNSTGYQFRVGEGTRALDNSYASRGVGQSGAAAKAALQYGQNIASGEFANYLNALQGQQGVGLSAAGAQAGVSTNFVNQTTQNNNNAASALANAAIAKGNATGNMWQGIAGGLGSIFGSSFG